MVGWYKNDKEDNAHCRAAFVFQSLHWISEHLKQYSAIQHNATHCNATRCNALLHFKQAHNTQHATHNTKHKETHPPLAPALAWSARTVLKHS